MTSEQQTAEKPRTFVVSMLSIGTDGHAQIEYVDAGTQEQHDFLDRWLAAAYEHGTRFEARSMTEFGIRLRERETA